ncbi:MAG TPA: hypothetical protein VNT56_00955, partial [Acidimicrobiales bacterium]|nr:hypothetical protein [Acidimicrobiales bacterium]
MATGGELAKPRWAVEHVAETGSTNADLLQRARAGAPAGSVLVAGYQRAGPAGAGRRWSSRSPPR